MSCYGKHESNRLERKSAGLRRRGVVTLREVLKTGTTTDEDELKLGKMPIFGNCGCTRTVKHHISHIGICRVPFPILRLELVPAAVKTTLLNDRSPLIHHGMRPASLTQEAEILILCPPRVAFVPKPPKGPPVSSSRNSEQENIDGAQKPEAEPTILTATPA